MRNIFDTIGLESERTFKINAPIDAVSPRTKEYAFNGRIKLVADSSFRPKIVSLYQKDIRNGTRGWINLEIGDHILALVRNKYSSSIKWEISRIVSITKHSENQNVFFNVNVKSIKVAKPDNTPILDDNTLEYKFVQRAMELSISNENNIDELTYWSVGWDIIRNKQIVNNTKYDIISNDAPIECDSLNTLYTKITSDIDATRLNLVVIKYVWDNSSNKVSMLFQVVDNKIQELNHEDVVVQYNSNVYKLSNLPDDIFIDRVSTYNKNNIVELKQHLSELSKNKLEYTTIRIFKLRNIVERIK